MPAFGLQISGAAVRVALASGVGLAFSLLVDGAPRAVFGVGFGREEGALEPRLVFLRLKLRPRSALVAWRAEGGGMTFMHV